MSASFHQKRRCGRDDDSVSGSATCIGRSDYARSTVRRRGSRCKCCRRRCRGSGRGTRRRTGRSGAAAVRDRRDVHAERRPHLAALRGGSQPGDASRRHPPRTVRHVRRRGLRQADPATGAGGAHRRAGDHERHLGGDVGVVQRVARWSCSADGRRRVVGARDRCRSSTTCRSSRRSPSRRRRSPIRQWPARWCSKRPVLPRRRIAARSSSTSPSTCSARRRVRSPASIRATKRA